MPAKSQSLTVDCLGKYRTTKESFRSVVFSLGAFCHRASIEACKRKNTRPSKGYCQDWIRGPNILYKIPYGSYWKLYCMLPQNPNSNYQGRYIRCMIQHGSRGGSLCFGLAHRIRSPCRQLDSSSSFSSRLVVFVLLACVVTVSLVRPPQQPTYAAKGP